ncbi:thioredoxin domain-containing protein [Streptomyces sp. NPDC006798]|uniref:thioredoxin family protein n=1 Tax=Streptomyces sp. NPDC006798 TaxID=3155462 RepID=UPI0033C31643
MTTNTTPNTTPNTAPAGAAGAVTAVTDEDFATEVLGAGLPVLVKFTADWCPPCRMMVPVLADIARTEAGRLKVVELDVDHNPETARRYGVLSAPTLTLFHGGEPVHSSVGARPKRLLLRDISEALGRESV